MMSARRGHGKEALVYEQRATPGSQRCEAVWVAWWGGGGGPAGQVGLAGAPREPGSTHCAARQLRWPAATVSWHAHPRAPGAGALGLENCWLVGASIALRLAQAVDKWLSCPCWLYLS